ncbi:unnamed protein product [Gadus morhua 'NCC']
MAEVIYATPNMMTKARNTQGEREEGIEDDYDSMESLGDQHQDYVGTEESSNTLGTNGRPRKRQGHQMITAHPHCSSSRHRGYDHALMEAGDSGASGAFSSRRRFPRGHAGYKHNRH